MNRFRIDIKSVKRNTGGIYIVNDNLYIGDTSSPEYKAIESWVSDGNIVEDVLEPIPVPIEVAKRQVMIWAKKYNKWGTFKTFLSQNEDAKDEWEVSNAFRRDNGFVIQYAPLFGLNTEDDLDNFFIEVDQL